jgi:transposase-like protein
MFAQFKTLPQLFDFFKDEETCIAYWEQIRWNGNVTCPHCNASNPYKTNRGYKCKNVECQKKFSSLVGSIFENSKMPLRTWFGAIYLCTSHKKGVSSLQLSRDLGIHQSSAWFLLHRIRETLMEIAPEKLGGEGCIVEADTTIVGGKAVNMTNKRRRELSKKGRNGNKTKVTGVIERGGNIRFDVVDGEETESGNVSKHIDKESVLMTDSATNFHLIGREFAAHQTVDHSKGEYVKDKVIHTNTIEGAFSHFDRMVIGVYHNISRKHMQAYANECAYRYNTRKSKDPIRFENTVLKCSGVRLKYNTLIAK